MSTVPVISHLNRRIKEKSGARIYGILEDRDSGAGPERIHLQLERQSSRRVMRTGLFMLLFSSMTIVGRVNGLVRYFSSNLGLVSRHGVRLDRTTRKASTEVGDFSRRTKRAPGTPFIIGVVRY
jgi:hypothetical protein